MTSKTYKTGDACRLLDVQPYVLRYWETEFTILGGKKSGPQRVYSESEVTILRRIKELLYDEGYTIAGAKKKLVAEIQVKADLPAGEPAEGAPSQPNEGKASSKPKKRGRTKAAAKSTLHSGPRQVSLTEADDLVSSLDSRESDSIETSLFELRRLHAEAKEILELVRKS